MLNFSGYKADFRWGKPFYIGIRYVSPDDRGIILPSPDEDGSVIARVHFQVELVQIFKKFFYADFLQNCNEDLCESFKCLLFNKCIW